MSYGLYGGSFDPIHLGHLEMASAARAFLGLERVVFLPAGRPPHKPDRQLMPSYHRFALIAAAILDRPWAEVSAWELEQSGSVRTIEQVAAFRAARPQQPLVLLVGADSLADFSSWYRVDELVDTTAIAVLPRQPWDRARLQAALPAGIADRVRFPSAAGAPPVGEIWVLPIPPTTISATEVRARLGLGQSVIDLVPSACAELIARHHLGRQQ